MKIFSEKGLTLVELLAAITIFSFMIGIIFTVFIQTDTFFGQKFDQYIEEGDLDRVKMTIYELTSNVKEFHYTSGEELKIQSLNQECHSIRVNAEQQALYHYKSSCDDLNPFTYENGSLLLKDVNRIQVFEQRSNNELEDGTISDSLFTYYIWIEGKETIRHSFRLIK